MLVRGYFPFKRNDDLPESGEEPGHSPLRVERDVVPHVEEGSGDLPHLPLRRTRPSRADRVETVLYRAGAALTYHFA